MQTLAVILDVLSLALLAWTWMSHRQIYLLPSSWVLLLSATFYMLPALIFTEEIADVSPYTWTALAYCAAFVGVGTLLNLVTARAVTSQVRSLVFPVSDQSRLKSVDRVLKRVLVSIGVIALFYLFVVPLTSTGLYGLLFDPAHSAQLREDSLKLVDNRALQYVYLVGFSCLSPLAFALVLARTHHARGVRRWLLLVGVVLVLSVYLLVTGARVGLINLAVVGLFFTFLTNGMRFGLRSVVLGGVAVMVVPIVLSMLREGGGGETSLIEYVEAIGDRIFVLPLLISGWFVEFAETRGYAGLFAALGWGAQTDWTNVIALAFLDRKEAVPLDSVTTPTSFFFTNYLYLGWLGLLPSWLALKVMDLPVLYLGRLPKALRVPFAATALYFAIVFVRAGFGVTLISHGYVLLIFLMHALAIRRTRQPVAASRVQQQVPERG